MRGNPGTIVMFADGSYGVAHNRNQIGADRGKLVISLVDETFRPIISASTGRQQIRIVRPSTVTVIGKFD